MWRKVEESVPSSHFRAMLCDCCSLASPRVTIKNSVETLVERCLQSPQFSLAPIKMLLEVLSRALCNCRIVAPLATRVVHPLVLPTSPKQPCPASP